MIPFIDINAAFVLLEEEEIYINSNEQVRSNNGDGEKNDDDDDDSNNKNKASSLLQVTNLQKRCVESFVDTELEISDNKELREQAINVMSSLSNHIMGYYLKSTLNIFGEEKINLKRQLEEKEKKIMELETVKERYDARNHPTPFGSTSGFRFGPSASGFRFGP